MLTTGVKIMSKVTLTAEQLKCINHEKGNLIVSAAAGSGKTHVIIERIIRLVKDKRVSVDKILAVTFTRLAADEMKEKLKKALIKEFNETGEIYFKEQLNVVSSADISTIHSFLGNLLRTYFYKINLDPNFEIADERKSKKIMKSALKDLFEELYETGEEKFLEVLNYYAVNRQDDSFKQTIIDLYNFSNSESSIESLRVKSLKFHDEAFEVYKSGELNSIIKELKMKVDGYDEEKLEKTKNTVNVLLDLTEKFKEKYTEYKREENAVDFADLEFLSIELFKNEDVLLDIKNKYEYIFVDEYQDVNSVQEEIIQKLSDNNAFMVGDSKQSIYGFRGCNPKYFINKYDDYNNNLGGEAIPLNKNFRSAKNIVKGVNNVFSEIMTEEVGDFNYSANQMVYGEGYGEDDGEAVIKIVENDIEVKDSQLFKGVYSVVKNSKKINNQGISAELLALVDTIKKVYKTSYYDVKEGKYKQVEYDDICILTRSIKSTGENIIKALIEYDIPVSSSVKNEVSAYPEIKALHSAVKALTYMQSDVDLASVMLNFGNFDEDELVKIRKIGGFNESFYDSVKKASLKGDEFGEKIKNFITWFNEIRLFCEYMPASIVLRRVISESNWDLKLMATSLGKNKMARVERFLSEADFATKPMTIAEFNEYLEEFIDEISFTEADGEGTVKLMTAHGSKGLEFPVVIVVGVTNAFSSQDLRNQLLMDREYGIAPKCYDSANMTVMHTPAIALIKNEYKIKRTVEEIRLFYVQLTRAKYKLYVIVDEEIPDIHDMCEIVKAKSQKAFLAEGDMPIERCVGSILQSFLGKEEDGANYVVGDYENDVATNKIVENLTYEYPFNIATTLPLKTSVSKLNERDKEYYKISEAFGESTSEMGTAYHRFLELSSFNPDLVEEELQNFLTTSKITKEESDLLDVNKLKSILTMPIFAFIRGKNCYKERKFCNFIDAKEIGYDVNEKVLVQGIIDLIVEDDDGLILIDYKLSKIEEDSDIIEKYSKQLSLYKRALENCMGAKVKKVYLINILQEKIIELNGI